MKNYISILFVVLIVLISIHVYRTTEAFTSVDASGNTITIKVAASGNNVSTIASKIAKAVNGSSNATGLENDSAKAKTIQDSAPAPVKGVSNEFSLEMENRIAKNIVTQVKDALLMSRSLDNTSYSSCGGSDDSVSSQQGQDYISANPAQKYNHGAPSASPDMSKYIKKDSIPCWNCTLPA